MCWCIILTIQSWRCSRKPQSKYHHSSWDLIYKFFFYFTFFSYLQENTNESQKLAINIIDNYEYYALEKVYKNKYNIIYIPFSFCTEILGLYHDSPASGHPGHSHTTFTLHQYYWWPGATKDIKNYVDHYQVYILTKGSSKPPAGKLIPLPIPTKSWTNISINFITGLPLSNNFDSICTILDHFSKDLARLFRDHVWCVHKLPCTIVSNWGLQFASKFTQDLCQFLNIKQKLSTTYYPQNNGQIEHLNREVEQYLCAYMAKQQED